MLYSVKSLFGDSKTVIVFQKDDQKTTRQRGTAEVASVFVVDASGSMGAEERIESAKGAALSLFKDAYLSPVTELGLLHSW